MTTEFLLIEKIRKQIVNSHKSVIKGIGDDTAVVGQKDGLALLYTCDSLVEDVHFSLKYMTSYQLGKKAMAVNMSDIAAMGGKPMHCLVSLFLPKNISEKFVDQLYKGIRDEGDVFDVSVIGGNIASSEKIIIDIFMIGSMNSSKVIYRSGAKVGDKVLVTGTQGDSSLGLFILNHKDLQITPKDKDYLVSKHLNPTAAVRIGTLISDLGVVTSMIDLSDGLSSDIGHICDESNVGVEINGDLIPKSEELKNVCLTNKLNMEDFTLHGGEDYELCFTVSKEHVEDLIFKIKKETGVNVSIIGEIKDRDKGRILIDSKKNKTPLVSKGWDHLH